jgi:hypothetical protein
MNSSLGGDLHLKEFLSVCDRRTGEPYTKMLRMSDLHMKEKLVKKRKVEA